MSSNTTIYPLDKRNFFSRALNVRFERVKAFVSIFTKPMCVCKYQTNPHLLQSVLLDQLGDLLDVGLLRIVLGRSLVPVPRFPLGLALEVEQTRLFGVAIADGSLLVQTVDLQQVHIGRRDLQVLNVLRGLFESLLGSERKKNNVVNKH